MMTLSIKFRINSNIQKLLVILVRVGGGVTPQDKERERTHFKVLKILCPIVKTKLN